MKVLYMFLLLIFIFSILIVYVFKSIKYGHEIFHSLFKMDGV